MPIAPRQRPAASTAASGRLRNVFRRGRTATVPAGLLILVTSIAAPAIVRRHDVSDFKYRELGESYRQTIVEGIVPSDGSPMIGNGNGTLVAAEWILTAAHVAKSLAVGSEPAESKPAKVSINGIWYLVESVHLHPGWKGNDSPEDIALIKLKEPVPGAKPACLYPGKDEVGQTAVVVGTGGTGDGVTGARKADGKLRGATVRVDRLGNSGMQIAWRFRGPTDPGVTPLEGISGRGDSGGPAFLRHKGKLCVAGVSSAQERNGLKNGQYGVDEFYSRVSFFRPWLQKVMAEGGSAKLP